MGVAVRANKQHQARHYATGNGTPTSCRERIAPSAGEARPRACPAKTRINHGQSSNCPTKNAIAPPKTPGFHKRAFSLAAISSCFHSPKRHDSLNVCPCLSRQRYIPPLPVAFFPFPPFCPTEGCRLELLLRNRRPRISILLPVPFTTPHHTASHHITPHAQISTGCRLKSWRPTGRRRQWLGELCRLSWFLPTPDIVCKSWQRASMNTYQLASGHWRRPFSLPPSWPISGRCRSAGSTSMRAGSSNYRLRYGVLLHLSCSALRSWALCWIRTLVSNPCSKKTSWSTRMLTRNAAYLYLGQLETSNPKFQRKEDVLWYLITVGGFIIVGLTSLFFSFSFFLFPS